jgi:hypothetical protein
MLMICKTLAEGAKINLARDNANKACNWPLQFASHPSTLVITNAVPEKVHEIYSSDHSTTKGGLYASMHALHVQLPLDPVPANTVESILAKVPNPSTPKTILDPSCMPAVPKKSHKGKGKAAKVANTNTPKGAL